MRVGLVGTEDSIRRHIQSLHELALVEISGYLCPEMQGNPSDIRAPFFHPQAFDAFINQSDAFVFSGTGMEYYHYAIQAIRNTRHIFFDQYVLEMPARLSEIQKLSIEANTRVQIRNDKRTHPAWKYAMKMVSSPQYAEFLVSEMPVMPGMSSENWVKRLAMDLDLLIDVVNTGIRRTSPTGISVMQKDIDLLNLKLEFVNGFAANLNYRVMPDVRTDRCIFYEKGSVIDIDFLNCSVVRKSPSEHKKFSIVNNSGPDGELEQFLSRLLTQDRSSANTRYDQVMPLQIAQQAVEKIQHRRPVLSM